MTDRERFLRCCLGQDVDRPPYWLNWGPWGTTWKRWQGEGMAFKDFGEVRRSFGAESPPRAVPVNCGPCPKFERTILEETDEWYIYIDTWGIKRRNFKHHESMSEFLEFPVKTRDDWERYKAERLDPDHPDRFKADWRKVAGRAPDGADRFKDAWREPCAEWMERGYPIQLGYYPDVALFGGVRWLLGDLECLMAFYDTPDLVADIMAHLTGLYLRVFERVVEAGVRVDVIHIWEDMSGRQGPLISPAHFRQFMTPNYAKVRAFADRHNIPLMSVDTDGQPDAIVPPMMEGGVNYLWPLEVAAGCDALAYRRKYPTLALMGGIDKRALAAGPEAIDAELERVRPAVQAGRYVPDLDHLIPDDVSWENFCYYARGLKRLVGKV